MKTKIFKLSILFLAAMFVVCGILTGTVQADVITDYDGSKGNIGSSSLAKGFYNLISNLAGTLQWVIPITGIAMILWYVFRIMTGDEQDQQRYKKGLIKVLICIVVAEIAVTLINLIAGYFAT